MQCFYNFHALFPRRIVTVKLTKRLVVDYFRPWNPGKLAIFGCISCYFLFSSEKLPSTVAADGKCKTYFQQSRIFGLGIFSQISSSERFLKILHQHLSGPLLEYLWFQANFPTVLVTPVVSWSLSDSVPSGYLRTSLGDEISCQGMSCILRYHEMGNTRNRNLKKQIGPERVSFKNQLFILLTWAAYDRQLPSLLYDII